MPVLKILNISSEFKKKFKNISFILENTKYAFFSSRISFIIGLWTHIVRYRPDIKNIYFSLKFQKIQKHLKNFLI